MIENPIADVEVLVHGTSYIFIVDVSVFSLQVRGQTRGKEG